MKKYIFSALLLAAMGVSAQSSYEAARLFDSDLTGTARFVAMGGSMSALGADVSVMSVNPAGTALYRTGDIAFSMGFLSRSVEADYNGTISKNNNSYFGIDNVGMVYVNYVDEDSEKFLNFGFNYKRRNDLRNEFSMFGLSNGFSQMYQMQQLYYANKFPINDMSSKLYTSGRYSWLALLGADGGLLSRGESVGNGYVGEGELVVEPNDFHSQVYNSEEKGGVDQIDINVSTNINDQLYLGFTIGAYNVDYSRSSYYGEDDDLGEIYTLNNWYDTKGSGVDVKLGAIMRPIYESSFRIGVAVHTPTWYNLTDCMSAAIYGLYDADDKQMCMDTFSPDAYGNNYYVDYRLTTPWRFNVSTAYIYDNFLAMNAEYEYADYSVAGISIDGDNIAAIEEEFESNMRGVHTFRAGAEMLLNRNLSMRFGYNYITAPFKKDAAKFMLSNMDTNTEYLNRYDTQNITLGAGFRKGMFYVDAAYLLSMQKADFAPYYDAEIVNPVASVTDTKHKFMMTVGMRF